MSIKLFHLKFVATCFVFNYGFVKQNSIENKYNFTKNTFMCMKKK